MRRAVCHPRALVCGAFLLLVTGPDAATSQETEAAGTGWLGVGLKAGGGECTALAEGPCGPAVVGSVILGGPAHRAGLQPGDTLLAMGDRSIDRGPADPAFREMRAGSPVTVRVARDGERLRVRLVPRHRPDSLAVVRLASAASAAAPEAPDEPAPSPSPMPGYALAVPETVRPGAGKGPGAPRADEAPEAAVVRLIPSSGAGDLSRALVHARTEELRAAMQEARADMVRRERDLAAARRLARELELQAARMAAEQWRRWMDDSLRVRLDAIHDSVLSQAREQLEALVEVRSRARRRAAMRAFPTRPVARDRIAGAEMEGLNPELSQFFGGLEEGVLVLRVLPQTPAAEMGLRPGDVIVEAAGRRVQGVDDLRAAFGAAGGSEVRVKWMRKGAEHTGRLQR